MACSLPKYSNTDIMKNIIVVVVVVVAAASKLMTFPQCYLAISLTLRLLSRLLPYTWKEEDPEFKVKMLGIPASQQASQSDSLKVTHDLRAKGYRHVSYVVK